jgi:hypothetical protein
MTGLRRTRPDRRRSEFDEDGQHRDHRSGDAPAVISARINFSVTAIALLSSPSVAPS